jgi:hypothetical protein
LKPHRAVAARLVATHGRCPQNWDIYCKYWDFPEHAIACPKEMFFWEIFLGHDSVIFKLVSHFKFQLANSDS